MDDGDVHIRVCCGDSINRVDKQHINYIAMKKIFLILALSVSAAFCDTPYSVGFSDGYKEGYCDGYFGCITPIVPICPIPRIGEDINSYRDGYNRGFLMGYRTNH